MLDKNVFKEEMQKLVIFYPSWNIRLDDKETMRSWYAMFKKHNATNETMTKAVYKHIETIKFNPTVASLIDCGIKKYTSSENEDVPDWVWKDW